MALSAARSHSAPDSASAPATSAQTKEASLSAWRQGNTAYNLGHYSEAAEHFEAAYKLVQDPVFLFNLAQSYRMDNQQERALDRYRAFLRTAPKDAPNRDVARRFSDELQRKIEQKAATAEATVPRTEPQTEAFTPQTPPVAQTAQPEAATASPQPAQAKPMAVPLPKSDVPEAKASLELTTKSQPSPERPLYTKWWFLVGVAGVVAAATVTAILFAGRSDTGPCGASNGLTCMEIN